MWQCGSGGGVIELFYLTVTQTLLTFRGHFLAIKILPALQYIKHISMLASPQLLHVAFHLDRVLKKKSERTAMFLAWVSFLKVTSIIVQQQLPLQNLFFFSSAVKL